MSTGSACDFASDYEIGQSPLMLEIEQHVRGSAYGATSWTTRAQAEAAAARLGLATGHNLLELGGGSGWPALLRTTSLVVFRKRTRFEGVLTSNSATTICFPESSASRS